MKIFVSIKTKSKVKGKGKGKGNFTLTRIDDYQNKKDNIMNDGFAFYQIVLIYVVISLNK